MRITDEMTTHALGFGPEQLVGKTIVASYDIEDSDRCEGLLVCSDGTVVVLSCDPVTHDDEGRRLPPERWGEEWEVVLYDATDTEAGRAVLATSPAVVRP